MAASVIETVVRRWESLKDDIRLIPNANVTSIEYLGDGEPIVNAEGSTAHRQPSSTVLIAVGFGLESKTYVAGAGLPDIAPHDLRRATAKLCRAAGGELEQIQLLLGHSSVQTTERYLGTKQDLAHAPNDAIKLKLAV